MTDDVDTRRRRAVYRACHRGTKEMDWMLGRFAQAALGGMPVDRLDQFERLLALPDPDLQDMILHPELAPGGEFADLIARRARLQRAWRRIVGRQCFATPRPSGGSRHERNAGRCT